jgi:zinc-binding alcohol dehydrogenase/oxidoreductase
MLPLILGSEGSGVIEMVGTNVEGWSEGQEVVIYPALAWGDRPRLPGGKFRILGGPDQGTYAQKIVLPVANVFHKPKNLSFIEASSCPVGVLTAWRALISCAGLRPGESVLLPGIGSGVAIFALQIAKYIGAQVFVTSHSDKKLQLASQLGADIGINYHTQPWQKMVLDATDGQGVDIILDSVGMPTFEDGLKLLSPGGRMITYGATGGSGVKIDVRLVYSRYISIIGTTLGSPWEFEQVLSMLESGRIKPVIDRVFPLAEAANAQQYLDAGEQFGKVVLQIN